VKSLHSRSGAVCPQQPKLRYWQEAEDQEPWADRVWRVWVWPLLWHGFWFFFWFAMTILSGFLGIYFLKENWDEEFGDFLVGGFWKS